MSTAGDAPRFETVDWDDVSRSRRIVTAERVVLLLGLLIVGALYLYDKHIAHVYLVFNWRVHLIDWVFLVAVVIITALVGVPLLRRRDSVRETLRPLRSKPIVLFAGGYLVLVAFAGFFGSILTPTLTVGTYHHNPPMGLTTDMHNFCAGRTSGTAFEETCRGAWRYPLGTNRLGYRVEHLVILGARPALYVAVIGGLLVIPTATAVGVLAGLRGGLVDRFLMAYVDLQLSLPAIFIYFLAFMYWGPSLLVLLFAFGLLSWGGLARLIRSEVIQRKERGHVRVARSLGASERYIARRHILPNITNTLVPAVCHLLALLVLYEAGVAFLGFHEVQLTSWGSVISESISAEIEGQHQRRTDLPTTDIWWVSTFPALALALTMASLKIVGDGLRDALDPRGEQ